MAAGLYAASKKDHKPFRPADFGSEFSIADIENYPDGVWAANASRDLIKRDPEPYKSSANAA
jgi:hypothetical protein